MIEWKRTVLNKRFLCLLLGVIILNGVFFLKAQFDRDLGLDLSEPESQLPNSIVVSEEGIPTSEQPPQISIKALYQEYLGLLRQMKQRSPDEITAELTKQMKQLSTLWDGCVLHERKENSEFDGVQWQNFVQQQPKAADEIINNTITKETVYSKYVAVHTLLQRAEVLASFPERLLAIEKNKETMEDFPLFQDKTNFSYQNILKTANEFRRLQGVPLSLENSRMIEGILTFGGSDFLLLVLLAAAVLSFLAERKRGLWGLIHSFPQGRDTLALHRLGILFCISFVGTLLLYGSNILMGTILYGGIGNLHIGVQSVPMLQEFPVLVSQGGFLIRYCAFRIISAFLLGLILWLLTGAASDVRCGVVLGVTIVLIEYGLYRLLPVQSAYNILKYLNICTYFHIAPLYTHYLNVDIGGFPMSIRRVSEVAALPLTLLTSGGCIAGKCFRRPTSGKNWGEIIFGKMRKWTDCCLRRLPLWGREVYKILFSQRGILIFLLFSYLALGIEHRVPIRATNEQKVYEWQYLAQLQGTITPETFSVIDDLQNEQEEIIRVAEQSKEDYSVGKITRGEYMAISFDGEIAQKKWNALEEIENRAESLKKQGETRGFAAVLLDETPYESIYGAPAKIVRLQSLLLIGLTIFLLLGWNRAYERKSGMIPLVRSMQGGRGRLFVGKLLAAVFITTLLWAIMYGKEFSDFYKIFPKELWHIAPQNLTSLTNLSISCSLAGYFVTYYFISWLCIVSISVLLMTTTGGCSLLNSRELSASS